MSNKLKIGDYVKVIDGLKEPGYDTVLMDNWQGEITAVDDDRRTKSYQPLKDYRIWFANR